MRFLILILSFLSLALVTRAQKTNKKTTVQKRKISHEKIFTGVATYYHNKFHGRKMSNGEIYSKNKLTAASNKIPLNKWIRVTNLRNNRSVIAKVTDRMHPRNKLLLDLSYAAALKMKMTGRGRTDVRVEVLDNYHPPKQGKAK